MILTSTDGQKNLPRYFATAFGVAQKGQNGRIDFVFDDEVLLVLFWGVAEASEAIRDNAAREAKKSRRFKKNYPAKGWLATETKRPCRRHGLMNYFRRL